jgi:hypothetical protein
MAHHHDPPSRAGVPGALDHQLRDLTRALSAAHYGDLATQAAQKPWAPVASLGRLSEGEAHLRRDRATHNRRRQARFPVITTLAPCRWAWPTQRNRLQGPHHVGLGFIQDKAHLLSLGGVGLGPPPLATALGSPAGLQG